jgi:hypothetical protein
MKKINIVIVTLFVLIVINCKAQQIPVNQYDTAIIGTWLLEDETNQKLVFTADGICKIYEDDILHTTCQYSFESVSCENYSAEGVVYLKWKEADDPVSSCLEVSSMTNNTLSLMLIDNAKILFYNKQ